MLEVRDGPVRSPVHEPAITFKVKMCGTHRSIP
jgi:hypothetical protein